MRDFFKEFRLEEQDDLFYIEDNKVAEWLDIELQTLRNRLRNKYSHDAIHIENVDYVRDKKGKIVTYILSYKCFESLAMMSETKRTRS